MDLARELKKLWNMKVTIIPIVIGAFGTITKRLLKILVDLGIRGRVVNIKHYWERPEYWEESKRLEETCCHSNSSERPSANTDVKNSQWVNNNNNNNNNNKWQTTSNWRNRTTKSRQDQNARRKQDLQILRNLGGWHHQRSGNEKQNSKRISQETKKLLHGLEKKKTSSADKMSPNEFLNL